MMFGWELVTLQLQQLTISRSFLFEKGAQVPLMVESAHHVQPKTLHACNAILAIWSSIEADAVFVMYECWIGCPCRYDANRLTKALLLSLVVCGNKGLASSLGRYSRSAGKGLTVVLIMA
jgi:hypothetical protein